MTVTVTGRLVAHCVVGLVAETLYVKEPALFRTGVLYVEAVAPEIF